ncbi:MAG: patatin-like phospholipase family protein [Acidobacteriota bacterium]
MLETVKVGVALGGGAARGLAHIGVLQALQEAGVSVDVLAGTSIGALVAGVYATSKSPREMEERFSRFVRSKEFRRAEFDFLKETKGAEPGILYSVSNLIKRGIFYSVQMTRPSFITMENFAHNIRRLIPDMRVERTLITLVPVAVDLDSGKEVLLTTGPLRRVIMASAAIPGILPPVEFGGRRYIDGGWISKIPVLAAFREGADIVIAVDVSDDLGDTSGLKTGMDVSVRANAIKSEALKEFQLRFADVVIKPEVRDHHWADFASAMPLVERGRRAAREALPLVRRAIERARISSVFGATRGRRLAKKFF